MMRCAISVLIMESLSLALVIQRIRIQRVSQPKLVKTSIDNMPTYCGLMYTLYDLYLLRYVRKRKNYRAFSYSATGYLLDHITTTNMTSGELRDRLLYYMGYNKFSKVLQKNKKRGY